MPKFYQLLKKIELTKKKIAAIALYLNIEVFIIYIIVSKIKTRLNLLNKFIILIKYLDYVNIFLFKFAIKFLKYDNNNHAIQLKK